MEKLALNISKKASETLQDQVLWYIQNCGYSFARTLLKNFWTDVDKLCLTPTIGRQIPAKGKHEYRVYISHKKCLVKYWYNSRSLYVTEIVFTDTHSPRMF